MRLWAIEPAEKWVELCSHGVLHIGPDKDFQPPYDWIREQMVARIGPPPATALFPFWCIHKWEGKEGADIRTLRRWRSAGTRMVKIEFDCPDDMVLLADYALWMYVINHWYIPKSKADADAFDRQFPDHPYPIYLGRTHPNPRFQKDIRQSWERGFDLNWEDEEFTSKKAKKSILGWVWQIQHEWVMSHKFFTCCSRVE